MVLGVHWRSLSPALFISLSLSRYPSLLSITFGKGLVASWVHTKPWSANTTTYLCRSPKEYVTYEFSLPSPGQTHIFFSSYLNDLWDGKRVDVQVLFHRVLLSGFVYNSFSSKHFVSALLVHLYISMDTDRAWKKSRFISSDRSGFRVISLGIFFHPFQQIR